MAERRTLRSWTGRTARRRAWLLAWALLTWLAGTGSADGPDRRAPAPECAPLSASAEADRVRLVTFNVHHGGDIPALAAAIRSNPQLCAADAVLLQEIEDRPGSNGPARLAAALGWNAVYAPARPEGAGTHGLAVLSPHPLVDPEVIALKHFEIGFRHRPRIAQGVTLLRGGSALRLYNVHLDTRLSPEQRALQLAPVFEKAREAERAVIAGDVNTITAVTALLPGVPLPIPGASQAQGFDALMRANGYETPFEKIGSTGPLGMRLDGIFPRGLDVLGFAKESAVRISDHVPLWLDVRLGTDALAAERIASSTANPSPSQ
jgi:endonuclease/exonuclease/phosphatase family metal-dependent hydrolase